MKTSRPPDPSHDRRCFRFRGVPLWFTGSSVGLFGMSTKWFLLTIITFDIYSSRVYSHLQKWIIEHQEIDPATPPADHRVMREQPEVPPGPAGPASRRRHVLVSPGCRPRRAANLRASPADRPEGRRALPCTQTRTPACPTIKESR